MSRGLRAAVLVAAGLLWLSGALWMLAHYLFPGHNEFGALPNTFEAPLMQLHGLAPVVGVFLFGWLGASHMATRRHSWAGRPSGLWLMGCALTLIVSGYALYYTTGAAHDAAAVLHEWLGLATLGVALVHCLGVRAVR